MTTQLPEGTYPEEEVISIEEMRRNIAIQTSMTLLNRSADPANIETLLYTADKIEQYIANGLPDPNAPEIMDNVPPDVRITEDKPIDRK